MYIPTEIIHEIASYIANDPELWKKLGKLSADWCRLMFKRSKFLRRNISENRKLFDVLPNGTYHGYAISWTRNYIKLVEYWFGESRRFWLFYSNLPINYVSWGHFSYDININSKKITYNYPLQIIESETGNNGSFNDEAFYYISYNRPILCRDLYYYDSSSNDEEEEINSEYEFSAKPKKSFNFHRKKMKKKKKKKKSAPRIKKIDLNLVD